MSVFPFYIPTLFDIWRVPNVMCVSGFSRRFSPVAGLKNEVLIIYFFNSLNVDRRGKGKRAAPDLPGRKRNRD